MRKIKILFIDDNIKFIKDIKRYFELINSAYEIYTTGTGGDGLRILKEEKPHLLFCDLFMLDIDGDEVAEKAKSVSPDTIIIILTAFTDGKTDKQLKKIGVDYIIYKPIEDLNDFALRIKKILHDRGIQA